MEHYEKRTGREEIYKGKLFNVYKDEVELEDGSKVSRELVEHNGGVAIVAITDKNEVIMVKQFRYGVGEVLWELPAGKIDLNEKPETCGKRELEEETGNTSEVFEYLGVMCPTPAYDSEKIYIYKAEGLTKTKQHLDQGEFLTVENLPIDKVIGMCADGRITDAKTITGMFLYYHKNRHSF